VAAQLTIDESAATAAGQTAPDEQRRGFWMAGLGVFVLWNLFTLLGAVLGDALGDPRRWGLDGAAVAAFLALLWPRLKQREPVALAVLCGVVAALAVPLLPPGLPILLAAVVGAAWGWWGRDPDADAPAPPTAAKAEAP
jgi:predicted branched-subunit amino acid permease